MNYQSIILAAAALHCSFDFPINGTSEQTDPNKRLAPASRAQDRYHARFGLAIPVFVNCHCAKCDPDDEPFDPDDTGYPAVTNHLYRTTPIVKGPKKMSRAQRKAQNAKGKR